MPPFAASSVATPFALLLYSSTTKFNQMSTRQAIVPFSDGILEHNYFVSSAVICFQYVHDNLYPVKTKRIFVKPNNAIKSIIES